MVETVLCSDGEPAASYVIEDRSRIDVRMISVCFGGFSVKEGSCIVFRTI